MSDGNMGDRLHMSVIDLRRLLELAEENEAKYVSIYEQPWQLDNDYRYGFRGEPAQRAYRVTHWTLGKDALPGRAAFQLLYVTDTYDSEQAGSVVNLRPQDVPVGV